MQESAQVAKEARSLGHGLKESLQSHDPWDRDIEFQRKNLRTQYLKLLLSFPFSKDSKDVETHLWMQTSYQFIAQYKTRIGVLDRKLSAPTAPKNDGRHDPPQNTSGPVELRKLVSRFRQFLAEEERFYVQLLVRLRRTFDLQETQEALVNLDIMPLEQEEPTKSDAARTIFPVEGDAISTTSTEREGAVAIFAKFLICVGDIARYREKFSEMSARPRSGHEDGPGGRRGRGGRRGGPEAAPRPRNYTRARIAYSHARLLVPDDGNASHQLAIISQYENDTFGMVLHYYRALCVRQPFDPASANLTTVLKKVLEDLWRARRGRRNEEPSKTPKVVDKFKESIVVLHALWNLDVDESATKAFKHGRKVVSEFAILVADRALPDKVISEVVVLVLSALWKLRMIRDGPMTQDSKRQSIVEALMVSHVLEIFRVLLDVGSAQLAESPEVVQNEDDLALHITAVFRRTLPALRIASKWLRSNFSYIDSLPSAGTMESSSDVLTDFWVSFRLFFTALRDAFPPEKLPSMKGPLEEDVEMTGFSPIKRLMFSLPAPTDDGLMPGQSQVHPNEEQLMRISDLLADAMLIASIENSPVVLYQGKFVDRSKVPEEVEKSPLSPTADTLAVIMERHPDPPRNGDRDNDDDNATHTSLTTDDPVRDAFDTALAPHSETEDEEQEDEIVWNPRASTSPLPQPIQPPGSVSPPAPTTRRPSFNVGSPLLAPQTPKTPKGTTAQDLLKDVLQISKTSHEALRNTKASTAPQASLLFGSGSANAPTTSIWTDKETMSYPTSKLAAHSSPQPAFAQLFPGQLNTFAHGRSQSQGLPLSQTMWNSSYGASTQNSQHALPGTPPVAPFNSSPLVNGNAAYHPGNGFGQNGNVLHSPLYGQNAIPPLPRMQQPLMNPNFYHGYNGYTRQSPYPYDRDRQVKHAFSNVYIPPVQRTWGNT